MSSATVFGFLGLALAGSTSCRHTPPPRAPVPTRGRYQYIAVYPAGPASNQREIRGIVTFTGNSAVVDAQHGLCRPAPKPDPDRFQFTCDDVTTHNASFSIGSTETVANGNTCAEVRTTANGQSVCVRPSPTTTFRDLSVIGRLTVRPAHLSP